MEDIASISWKIIEQYFHDNPQNLVNHQIDSFNDFIEKYIPRIFHENNPIRWVEKENPNDKAAVRREMDLYLGGRAPDDPDAVFVPKIYFGKPAIYDDKYSHYMYPNEARLRNMTYGFTIHADIDVVVRNNNPRKRGDVTKFTLEKVYFGKYPIMLQSNMCILQGMATEVRYQVGECRQDYGGYFIIDGKEKCLVGQEAFANNMINIVEGGDTDKWLYAASVRSVSEDTSKPVRKTGVMLIRPAMRNDALLDVEDQAVRQTNLQIVVNIPNVSAVHAFLRVTEGPQFSDFGPAGATSASSALTIPTMTMSK